MSKISINNFYVFDKKYKYKYIIWFLNFCSLKF
jgi:hypothetical protein